MIDSRSPSFTPFGGSDFLMEEIDAFLEHDDSIPPGVDGIIFLGRSVYLEIVKVKSSCEDPPDLELKDLPSHLEYAFLEDPIDLDQEKTFLHLSLRDFCLSCMPFGYAMHRARSKILSPLPFPFRQKGSKGVNRHQSCANGKMPLYGQGKE
ncbi:hypothetical protein Tco_0792989 [Tanacetum coccineum]